MQASLGGRGGTHFISLSSYYPHVTGDPDEKTHGGAGSEDEPRVTETWSKQRVASARRGVPSQRGRGFRGAAPGVPGSWRKGAVEAAGANQERALTDLTGHL